MEKNGRYVVKVISMRLSLHKVCFVIIFTILFPSKSTTTNCLEKSTEIKCKTTKYMERKRSSEMLEWIFSKEFGMAWNESFSSEKYQPKYYWWLNESKYFLNLDVVKCFFLHLRIFLFTIWRRNKNKWLEFKRYFTSEEIQFFYCNSIYIQ